MNKAAKQVALLLLIALLAIAIFRMNDMNTQKVEQLQYSDFIKKVYENKVKSVTIVNGKKKLKEPLPKATKSIFLRRLFHIRILI